jgi:putative membrane protein
MMAWVRTAASMISFGFSVYKFFQLELGARAPEANRLVGARGFAILLIAIGLGSLGLGFIQDRRSLRRMRAADVDITRHSIAGPAAAVVAGLGTLAMALVLFRQ